jgi:hypothetical protein
MLTIRDNEHYWAEGTLDWEDAILEWKETEKLEATLQWRRGDIAVALKPVYGEQTLENFAKEVDTDYSTLRQYKNTAQAHEIGWRQPNVSFEHHRIIASRPDRLDWLHKAANGKCSVARMLDEIAAYDAQCAQESKGWVVRF